MVELATLPAKAFEEIEIHPDGRSSAFIDEGDLRRRVAEAAYYLAERRGFEPGHELEDWLEAEQQIKDELALTA